MAAVGTFFQAYRCFRIGDVRDASCKGDVVEYSTRQGRIGFMKSDDSTELLVYTVNVVPHLRRQGVFSQFVAHVIKLEQRLFVLAVETHEMVACLKKAGFRDQGGDFVLEAPPAAENARECKPLSQHEKRIADGHPDSSMQEIIERLFLGPFTCLRDAEGLTQNNVRYVVNLSQRCSCVASAQGIHVLDIMVEDEPEVDLHQHLRRIYVFLDAALATGESVLVNCIMGVSRSASVIVGYLMYRNGWSFEESLAYVKSKRACVYPNPGFRFQLTHDRMPTAEEQLALTTEHYADEETEVGTF